MTAGNNTSAHLNIGVVLLASIAVSCACIAQQISIARIDLMPNKPSPYSMRNWKRVAVGYDSLVFNQNLTGTYLPLVSVGQNFSLSSYVGQSPSQTKEAINCIPAVVSASLVGVDKTNQFGFNWVSACQDWFNQNPGEDVYLNNPGGSSGSDWWYDMMPNVFFYQLYSMYPSDRKFSEPIRYGRKSMAGRAECDGCGHNSVESCQSQPYGLEPLHDDSNKLRMG